MKRILIAILGVAALAACTKTEVVSISEGNTIKFDNAFVGNPTKAGLPAGDQVTTDNIKHFFVYANTADEVVFDEEKVYESGGMWVYDNLKKWESGKTYKFAAFAVKDDNTPSLPAAVGTASFDYDSHTLTIADYISDNVNQRDLLMATSSQTLNSQNEPVEFTFKHALSMVKFTFKSSLGDRNPITISDFKITGVNTKGTATIGTANTVDWTASSDPATTGTEFTDDAWEDVTTTKSQSSDEFVFIPQGGTDAAVTVTVSFKATITVESGSIEKNLTAIINLNSEETKWKPGLRYNYIATITGTDMDVIEFAPPVVVEWPADYIDDPDNDLTPGA